MHFPQLIVYLTLTLILLPATGACAYLFLLTLMSARLKPPSLSSRTLFFDVIVPAHNEAAGVAATVDNLCRLRWPPGQFRVIVIADNCTDDTARAARGAGAVVIERQNLGLRGKGYALAHAFEWSRNNGSADAVVVVDADSQASENLLESFAARIHAGSSALQAHYGVLNADASWRTRLMAIALGAIHKVRSRARERLGLSCGIRGNGWCVTRELLDAIPYRAYSLTEDVEFGVDLGLAGRRVAYCDEASVNGEMVTTETAARSQRQRWEGGRARLIRDKVPILLHRAVVGRSLVCFDLALDLLVLPLSYIALNVAIALALATVLSMWTRSGFQATLAGIVLADGIALAAYVCRGWMLSGVGPRGFLDLLRVPAFVAWKVLLLVSGPKATTWIRTKREGS